MSATTAQVLSEERAARAQHRAQRKLQRAAQQRQWRDRLAEILRDSRKTYPRCRCELRASMTREDLRALGGGCTDPQFVCPRLDAIRRRLGS